MFMVVTDDLLIGEEDGYRIADCSRLPDDPDYMFFLKVILLLVQGDYPAQGKNSGMTHSGGFHCHWCLVKAVHNKGVSRMVTSNYTHHYPLGHSKRPLNAPVISARTHVEVCRDALTNQYNSEQRESSNIDGADDDANAIRGVKEWCPLSALSWFDVVWDIVPDMMHIIKGLIEKYIVNTMKGKRNVKPPKPLVTEGYVGTTLRERDESNRVALQEFTTAKEVIVILNTKTERESEVSVMIILILNTKFKSIELRRSEIGSARRRNRNKQTSG